MFACQVPSTSKCQVVMSNVLEELLGLKLPRNMLLMMSRLMVQEHSEVSQRQNSSKLQAQADRWTFLVTVVLDIQLC